jgi:hypothetical protein
MWCYGIWDALSVVGSADATDEEEPPREEREEDPVPVKPEAEIVEETTPAEDPMTPRTAAVSKDEAVGHVRFGGRLHVWLKRKLDIRFVSAHADEPGVLVIKDDVKSTKVMEVHVKAVERTIVGVNEDEYEMLVSQATRRLRSNVDQIMPISLTLQCDEEPQPVVLFCDGPEDCDLWVLGLQTLVDEAALVAPPPPPPQKSQESQESQEPLPDAQYDVEEEGDHFESDSAADYFDPAPFVPILRSGVPLQRFTNAGKGKLAIIFLRVFFNAENRVESIGVSDKANFKKETLVTPVSVLCNIDQVSGLQKKQDVFNAARDFGFTLTTTERKPDLHEMFLVTQRSEDHYNWVRTLHETL